QGRLAPDAVDDLLAGGRRALHGRAAPPRGLTLERITYESADNRTNASAASADGATGHQGKPESAST
ncbi:MAG TPA: hypothetical protein VF365_04210, partial [Candidatus Limnocylindria bacterium]